MPKIEPSPLSVLEDSERNEANVEAELTFVATMLENHHFNLRTSLKTLPTHKRFQEIKGFLTFFIKSALRMLVIMCLIQLKFKASEPDQSVKSFI